MAFNPVSTAFGRYGMSDGLSDWVEWHGPYADPSSPLSRRLRIVRARLREWLDETSPRPVRVLSLCAGDGRDLLQVLAGRTDRDRVRAVLVELNPDLAARAEATAVAAGLGELVEVRPGDAGRTRSYADTAGSDLVLLAGVFGNISDQDVRQIVETLPMLCGPHARVIWTRHRNEPDLTGRIRDWFARSGFSERSFTAPEDTRFSVGVHDFAGKPAPWSPPDPLFRFVR